MTFAQFKIDCIGFLKESIKKDFKSILNNLNEIKFNQISELILKMIAPEYL